MQWFSNSTGAVDHPLGHVVAWDRALPASAVAIATSCVLVVLATVDFGVVLIKYLAQLTA